MCGLCYLTYTRCFGDKLQYFSCSCLVTPAISVNSRRLSKVIFRVLAYSAFHWLGRLPSVYLLIPSTHFLCRLSEYSIAVLQFLKFLDIGFFVWRSVFPVRFSRTADRESWLCRQPRQATTLLVRNGYLGYWATTTNLVYFLIP